MVLTNNKKILQSRKQTLNSSKTIIITLCIPKYLFVENRPDTNLNKSWIIQPLPHVIITNII